MRRMSTWSAPLAEGPVRGSVAVPGSKSITNRALLIAGLARGTSRLTGALKSDDTRWMAEALRANLRRRKAGPSQTATPPAQEKDEGSSS